MGMYDNWGQSNQYNRQQYNAYNQMQQSVAQNPFLMVPTIADVEKVVAQAGETRWIMVQNDAVIAVKTASAVGYATTEYYRLSKFDPAAMQTPAPGCNYVTEQQMEERINAAISQAMSQLQPAPAAKSTRTKEA